MILFLHYCSYVESLEWLCYVTVLDINPVFLFVSRLIVLQEDLHLDDEEKLGQQYRRLQQAMEMVGFLASTKKQYVWF